MATNQQFLVCDNSTYANYSQWASQISASLASFGWAQSTDTGQIMWSGMSITAVAVSGTTMTCTYSSQTGLPLAIGRALTVTGWTGGNTGNNGVFVITGGSLGAGSGTFTVINASAVVVASGGTGVVTIASAAPGSAAYFYEIWEPNDGLTNFFLKLEMGNTSGTNSPAIRVTVSSGTNGAGTATGLIVGPKLGIPSAVTAPSTTTIYECDFSGGLGRFNVMMWRNGANAVNQVIAIERSVNSSGVYTGAYVTVWTAGGAPSGANITFGQQTLLLGVGVAPNLPNNTALTVGGWAVRFAQVTTNTTNSGSFNNSIPFDTCAPLVGYYDYPCTAVGVGGYNDLAEGVTFQVTLYGSTRTYMVGKTSGLGINPYNQNVTMGAVAMRFD